jgi:hypothetical protein
MTAGRASTHTPVPAEPARAAPGPVARDRQARPRADRAAGNRAVARAHQATGGLDPDTRALMEHRFGYDFGAVRVHTGPTAESAARAHGARAFTVGHDIVFGRGAYDPASAAGRQVLAHELAHVVQQGRGAGSAIPGPQTERDADQAAAAFAAHPSAPVVVREASAIRLARLPEDSLGAGLDKAVDVVGAVVGGGGVRGAMLAAALRGFVAEMGRQLSGEHWTRFKAELVALAVPGNAAAFSTGYSVGAVAGLISPVTDLLGLVGFLQQLPEVAVKLAARVPAGAEYLVVEARALVRDGQAWLASVGGKVRGLDLKMINELLGAAEQKATAAAGAAGRGAARSVVEVFTGDEEEPATKSGSSFSITGALEEASRVRKSLLSSKWDKIGYNVGHAVGAVTSNVLLLVFSEGIGNAIAEIGAWLGKFGGLIAKAGEFVASIGKAIEAVEKAIGVLAGKLAKPFEPVLKPLAELFERLRGFLRKLLGVAEKSAATAAATAGAEAAEKKVAAAVGPKPAAAPAPKPKPKPKSVAPVSAEPAPAGPRVSTEPAPAGPRVSTEPAPAGPRVSTEPAPAGPRVVEGEEIGVLDDLAEAAPAPRPAMTRPAPSASSGPARPAGAATELDDLAEEAARRQQEALRRNKIATEGAGPQAQPSPRKTELPTVGERPEPTVIPEGGDRAAIQRRAQATEDFVEDAMAAGSPPGQVRTQVTVLNGEEVTYATKGAARLDTVADDLLLAIDAKNYDLVTAAGRRSLVTNATTQAIERARLNNLPPGYRQALVVDARGQRVLDREMQDLLNDLVTESGGQFTQDSLWIIFDP